jgi:hypothetical protein
MVGAVEGVLLRYLDKRCHSTANYVMASAGQLNGIDEDTQGES